MRRHGVWLAAAVLAVAFFASAAWAGPVSSKLSAADMEKLKAGQIIARSDIKAGNESGAGVAFGIIKCTPEEFWKTIFDHEHYTEFYPRLKKIQIVSRDNSKAVITFWMDVTLTTMEYTTIGIVTPDRLRMTWSQDDGKPHKYFKKNDGYWQLEVLDGGLLLVEYKVDVGLDLGVFSSAATKIVNLMAKDDLPEVVDATRKRIESGGTWKRGKK
jgi:ribosome-associated toxin RatA of RatAB toxin-antitoxin module